MISKEHFFIDSEDKKLKKGRGRVFFYSYFMLNKLISSNI